MIRKKTAKPFFVFLFLLLACSGCGRQEILIGFSGQLSGRYSDLGVQGRNGAILAVEQINATGGIAGKLLRLIPVDDGDTPQTALSADRGLIDSGVTAIIGHMTSSQSIAVLDLINDTGTVMLSPTTSSPVLAGKKDMFFRVHASTVQTARLFGEYAARNLGVRTLSSIWDSENREYSYYYSLNFTEGLKEGGGISSGMYDFSSADDMKWLSLIPLLKAENPDGLLITASAIETAAIIQAVRQAGISSLIFTSGWAATSALTVYAGHAGEGVYTEETGAVLGEGAGHKEFIETYTARFGSAPSFAAARSYDAVRVLAHALDKTGGKKKGLAEAVVSIRNFPGLYGPYSFDQFGDIHSPLTVLKIYNGQFIQAASIIPEADDE